MIIAAPNPAIDRLVEVPRLEPGEIHTPHPALEVAGGKGLNVARAAHTLGSDVVAIPLLGGHSGRKLAELLNHDGVPFDAVAAASETRSTTVVRDQATGTLTEFYERARPEPPATYERFRDRVLAHCSGGRWLTISGSLPPGIDPSVETELLQAVFRGGSPIAVDQHGPYLAAALRGRLTLVKINQHEARAATGAEPRDAAGLLAERAGGARVVVTIGADGALLIDDGRLWHGSLDLQNPYSTGCGDAFLAGMVGALQRTPDAWREAFAAGIAAGAANAELPGPGVLDPARARALIASVRITAL